MRRKGEIALVRKAKEGDTLAFAAMTRRYQNLVYATAFQILKDQALAEDVAQEAFVTAFRSLQDLRTESSFPPWLRKITRNLALASRKEQRRFGALEEAGGLQSPPAGAGTAVENERGGRGVSPGESGETEGQNRKRESRQKEEVESPFGGRSPRGGRELNCRR